MRKSLWKRLVHLFLLLVVVSGSVAWAIPTTPSQAIRPESPGIWSSWWDMLTEWLGCNPSALDQSSGNAIQGTTVEQQAPAPDPTLWECSPCTQAGPDIDPDG